VRSRCRRTRSAYGVSDKCHAFASSVAGEVTGIKVTLTAGPCPLGNVELIGPEKGKAPPHDAAT
jgi:hypothetical protein